jgi:hypothetical protein
MASHSGAFSPSSPEWPGISALSAQAAPEWQAISALLSQAAPEWPAIPALFTLTGHSGARFQGLGRAPEWLAPFRRERACFIQCCCSFRLKIRGCERAAPPGADARPVPAAVTSCPATSCPALGRARALHAKAGREARPGEHAKVGREARPGEHAKAG